MKLGVFHSHPKQHGFLKTVVDWDVKPQHNQISKLPIMCERESFIYIHVIKKKKKNMF